MTTPQKKVTAIQKAKIDFKGQPSLGAVLALMKLAAQEAREDCLRETLGNLGDKYRAQGAEAMRERCAKRMEDHGCSDCCDAILALPLTEAGKETK